jgi:ribosomal protein S18 acetylase RimI-like enzyme
MDFLYRVYASAREQEMAGWGWADSEKDAFLRMQFNAQHAHYQQQFGDADWNLVLLDGEPVGRLYFQRREDELHIIDIALMAEQRGQGVGSALLQDVLDQADQAHLPVRLCVERNNPALRLYQRLGFREVEDQGVYLALEWTPGAKVGQ